MHFPPVTENPNQEGGWKQLQGILPDVSEATILENITQM